MSTSFTESISQMFQHWLLGFSSLDEALMLSSKSPDIQVRVLNINSSLSGTHTLIPSSLFNATTW